MTSAMMEITIGDFKKSFQSSGELSQYFKERIVPKLQEAATEIWQASSTRPRALNQELTGEFAGLWVEDQQVNGRGVEVSVSVGIRF